MLNALQWPLPGKNSPNKDKMGLFSADRQMALQIARALK
jgi:hypothetical protein